MRDAIKNNLDQPQELERLYRADKATFRREFNLLYPEIRQTTTARIWNARINFENEEISWGSKSELVFVLAAALIAGLVAKIPDLAGLDPDYFYPRNIAFIVFPFLTIYFAWKHKVPVKHIPILLGALLIPLVYINLLPDDVTSDTLVLACIHLPFLLWAALGFAFSGDSPGSNPRRLDFLRYNGDLVVMAAIILIAGALLTAVTFGLFQLIAIDISEIFGKYIAVFGLAAIPIVGTYLVRTNPQLVNKVSPVIARVFTPLVLVTLLVYLGALIYSGKDPYNDRDFLLIFNLLLVGVMAIILFSIAEISKSTGGRKAGTILLFALSIVTIVVNGVALSAIVFRISEWGITPNRLAVLGGNVLILTNLLLVTYRLFKAMQNGKEIEKVENSIASFLPVYCAWTAFVTFAIPVLFGFK